MQLEPILLEAPLRAVLGRIIQALRAGVVRNELLVEFFTVLVLRIEPVLLLFPNVLQGTLIVAALAHVDELVARGLGRREWHLLGSAHLLHLHLMLGVSNTTRLHHARGVHEAALPRVKTYAGVATNSRRPSHCL